MHYWRGFSFLIGDSMTDKVQVKQDLEINMKCCNAYYPNIV